MRKIIKIIFVIIFFIIGINLITFGIIDLCWLKINLGDRKWMPIADIIFGSMLLGSPYFLK